MRSIADRSHDVKTAIRRLVEHVEERRYEGACSLDAEDVEDVLDKFMLWAGNVQDLDLQAAPPFADDRAEEYQAVQDQIYERLADLQEAVDDLERIVLRQQSNRWIPGPSEIASETSREENSGHLQHSRQSHDEAHMILEVMAQSVRSLFRSSKLFRNIGPRDDFKLVIEQDYEVLYPESFRSDIAGLQEKYPHLRDPQHRWLATRLGRANEKRRQCIQYRRDKHRESQGESNQAVSNCNLAEVDDNFSLTSASTISERQTSNTLPGLESLSPDREPFQCPICFETQRLGQEKAWELHAFRDLKAYVCTVGGTECESALFGDRNVWFEHELISHRAQYRCTLCTQAFGGDDASLRKHFIEAHGVSAEEQLCMLTDGSRVVPIWLSAENCPFCGLEWAQRIRDSGKHTEGDHLNTLTDVLVPVTRFRDHVAAHQESFAASAVRPTLRFGFDGLVRKQDSSQSETGRLSQDEEFAKRKTGISNPAQGVDQRDLEKQTKTPIQANTSRQQKDRPDSAPLPSPYMEEVSESDGEPIVRSSRIGRAYNGRNFARPESVADSATLVGSEYTSATGGKMRGTSIQPLIARKAPLPQAYYGPSARRPVTPFRPLSPPPPSPVVAMTPSDLDTQARSQIAGVYEPEKPPRPSKGLRYQPSREILDSFPQRGPRNPFDGVLGQQRHTYMPARQADEPGSYSTEHSNSFKGPIRLFVDHDARPFIFPFESCKEWQDVQELLSKALSRDDNVRRRAQAALGHFDVINEDGDIILPQFWHELIMPDSDVWISFWPTHAVISSGLANKVVLGAGPAFSQSNNSRPISETSSAAQSSVMPYSIRKHKLAIGGSIFDQSVAAQPAAGDYFASLSPQRPLLSASISTNNGSVSSSENTSDTGEDVDSNGSEVTREVLNHVLLESVKLAESAYQRQIDQTIKESKKVMAAMSATLGQIESAVKDAQAAARDSRSVVEVAQKERREYEAKKAVREEGAKSAPRAKTEDKSVQTASLDLEPLQDTENTGAETLEAAEEKPEDDVHGENEHTQTRQREEINLAASVKICMMALGGKVWNWIRNRR